MTKQRVGAARLNTLVSGMVPLEKITSYLADYLSIREVSDYGQAFNGLQLENGGSVTRIAAAVDACEAVMCAAVEQEADLLLVHHGLFWNTTPITGAMYRKVRRAIEGNLSVYSAHLPLDIHPKVGNNVLLAKALGLTGLKPFMPLKGQPAGLVGGCSVSLDALHERLESVLGSPVHVCAGGPARPRRVGVVTGGAGSEVARAAAEGIDTFITGEGPHWSYTLAEELGVNLLYGGHYATETFGVKALAAHLSKRFKLPWLFIDHPTGL
jgi:dinuclear metal center YbgI/SA1388 family protein